MKFSKLSLQEKIEENERQIENLKIMSVEFKTKYYSLQKESLELFSMYNLEKNENEKLRIENEKLKSIIEGLIQECENILQSVPLKDKVSSVYNEALIHYAISTLGSVIKK